MCVWLPPVRVVCPQLDAAKRRCALFMPRAPRFHASPPRAGAHAVRRRVLRCWYVVMQRWFVAMRPGPLKSGTPAPRRCGCVARSGSVRPGDLPMIDMVTRVVARAAVDEHKAGRLSADDLRQLRVSRPWLWGADLAATVSCLYLTRTRFNSWLPPITVRSVQLTVLSLQAGAQDKCADEPTVRGRVSFPLFTSGCRGVAEPMLCRPLATGLCRLLACSFRVGLTSPTSPALLISWRCV